MKVYRLASLIFLQCLVALSAGALDITKGSLRGTENDGQRGLTDKQLGLLRWMYNISEVPERGEMGWEGFNINPSDQLNMDGVRYSLAFLAYATSVLTYEHTPAYRQVANRVLHDLVKRMVNPVAWRYWSADGLCGAPWRSFCTNRSFSMCTLNNIGYKWQADSCPDPVAEANIMYSAHLAQMVLLYELHSHDNTFSEVGWPFIGPDDRHVEHGFWYTTPRLVEVLARQSEDSPMGGGMTCEPGNVFPSCNNHVRMAFRLNDALKGTQLSNRSQEWYDFMLNHTYNARPHARILGRRRATPEPLFKILTIPPITTYVNFTPHLSHNGCGAHDGWVLSWLKGWAPTDTTGDIMDQWLELVAKVLVPDGAGGGMLNDTCLNQNVYQTSILASSWVPFVGRQRSVSNCSLCDTVYRGFESQYGTLGDSVGDGRVHDMYYYNASGFVHTLATANLALSMAVEPDSLDELFSAAAVREYDATKPFLAHVPWPDVMVRRARYFENETRLSFTVLPSRAAVPKASLVCQGFDRLATSRTGVRVLRDGELYRRWRVANATRGWMGKDKYVELTIDSEVSEDTVFDIYFSDN